MSKRSPGIEIREIEVTAREEGITGTPAAVIGTAPKGRAFVPHVVGTPEQLAQNFGEVNKDTPGLLGAHRFLQDRSALAYTRVLGFGKNAGFKMDQYDRDTQGAALAHLASFSEKWYFTDPEELPPHATPSDPDHWPFGFFLVAQHRVADAPQPGVREFVGPLHFSPVGSEKVLNLVRFQIITPFGIVPMVGEDGFLPVPGEQGESGTYNGDSGFSSRTLVDSSGLFPITFLAALGGAPIVYASEMVSLEVDSPHYISRVLNTDPTRLLEAGHCVVKEWAVSPFHATTCAKGDSSLDLLAVSLSTPNRRQVQQDISQVTGIPSSDKTVAQLFGDWSDSYKPSESPWIVSQPSVVTVGPYGTQPTAPTNIIELNTRRLFRFLTIDDGTASATQVKVSILNLQASESEQNPYGRFDVQVRRWDDSDYEPVVLEHFRNLSLDPGSERYIARIIGDRRAHYSCDRADDERRITYSGKYDNQSKWIVVEVSPEVDKGEIPSDALPFGHESPLMLRVTASDAGTVARSTLPAAGSRVSLLPPIYRKKITTASANFDDFLGAPANNERLSASLHWGLQWELSTSATSWNAPGPTNPAVRSLCTYSGCSRGDQMVGGKEANKRFSSEFSLACVTLPGSTLEEVKSVSPREALRQAYYIRGSEAREVDSTTHTFTFDDIERTERVTLSTILSQDKRLFNRYSPYAKFVVPLQGGWDGTNPFWAPAANLSDRASGVTDTNPHDWTPGWARNVLGVGEENIVVQSVRSALEAASDKNLVSANILAAPGYREPILTEGIIEAVEDNGLMIGIVDVPNFREDGSRIWTGQPDKPDIDDTISKWVANQYDSSSVATYFPDVLTALPSGRGVVAPASVAGLAAFARNDRVGYPWFVPAGFNRGALNWVTGLTTKLRKGNRDDLYSLANINPIFSGADTEKVFAIMGQKTLLQNETSALTRVNSVRATLEAIRIVRSNLLRLALWEPADAETRKRFVSYTWPQLAVIQDLAGASSVELICDERNNSDLDERGLLINVSLRMALIRATEFIEIDIFISDSGDFGFALSS